MSTENGQITDLAKKIVEGCGGKENILCAINCMTRVRITTLKDDLIRNDELEALDGVLRVEHERENYAEIVVGPGKSRECIEVLRQMGIPEAPETEEEIREEHKTHHNDQEKGIRRFLSFFGQIFAPLIPGIIAAGMCAGFAGLISQVIPGYQDNKALSVIYQLLNGVNATLITFLTAWAGYRAAEIFGGTPILGGMLGMFTTLGNVDEISKLLGLYNEMQPLDAILRA